MHVCLLRTAPAWDENERVTSNEPATLLDVKKVRTWDEHLISRDKMRQQGSNTARPLVKPKRPDMSCWELSGFRPSGPRVPFSV
jgi:hypothetical protein